MRTVVLAVLLLLSFGATRASAAPFVVGAGFKPGVAVDAAGTAYIAWYGPEANTTTLRFCRLPRGASACDVSRTLNAPGTSLSRPFVVVSGATVRIIQYRYGITPTQIFVFTSGDGGFNFDAGRAAGEAPFDEAVEGTDGTVTVATNVWFNGGVVQRLPLAQGSAGSSWAALYGTDRAGNGTVAYAGGRLLAIFTGGVADAAYRLHSGQPGDDPNNAATWGPSVPIGYADYPKLATGPSGTFVLAGDANGVMYVRRWNGAGFDAPVPITTGDASESHLFVDAAGRLHAVYPRLDVQGYHLQHSVSDDGVNWRSGSLLVQTDDEEFGLRVATAADHVGVAAWWSRGTGGPEIRVSAVGPDAPASAPVVVQPPPPVSTPTPDPVPVFEKSVVVRPISGVVRVRLKGSSTFVNLTSLDDVPLGATIDTRRGRIELRSVPRAGAAVETVQLYEGMFRVDQRRGITNFTLNEPLAPCGKRARAAAKKPKVRRLWGDGKGRFRTSGKYSAATVRGTRWLVRDSCAGTLTSVAQGSVVVTFPTIKKRVIVRAGKKYLARAKRR